MIKFMNNNLVDSALITPSTENAQYPKANITDYRRTKVYRSTSNSDNIVFDLGSIEDVDTFCVTNNWRDGWGVSTITLEANATDSWGAPAFSESITFSSEFNIGIKEFTEVSYRYWRVVLTSTLGYCELSNIFIGKATTITTNGIDYGWSYRSLDLGRKQENEYGQLFADDRGSRKELSNLGFKVMNNTEMDSIFNLYDNNRTLKPFFVKIGDGTNVIISNEDRLNGFYRLKSEPTAINTTSGYYNITLNLKEQT